MSMSDLRFFLPKVNAYYANVGVGAGLKQARQSAYVFCSYLMLSAVLMNALRRFLTDPNRS